MKRVPLTLTVISVFGLASAVVLAADMAHHPHLHAAHNKCENAIKDLQQANNGTKEFGGHREKAIDLIKQAQAEIDASATYADQNPGKK